MASARLVPVSQTLDTIGGGGGKGHFSVHLSSSYPQISTVSNDEQRPYSGDWKRA